MLGKLAIFPRFRFFFMRAKACPQRASKRASQRASEPRASEPASQPASQPANFNEQRASERASEQPARQPASHTKLSSLGLLICNQKQDSACRIVYAFTRRPAVLPQPIDPGTLRQICMHDSCHSHCRPCGSALWPRCSHSAETFPQSTVFVECTLCRSACMCACVSCVCACVHVCVRACVPAPVTRDAPFFHRIAHCVYACVCAFVHACVRACMRACVLASSLDY